LSNEQVLGLDVSVNHVLVMAIGEGAGQIQNIPVRYTHKHM
jgi:hypothetical protein